LIRGDATDGAKGRKGDGHHGNADARVSVSEVKAMVPERGCQIIDQAIQIQGASGVSQWTPLADMYTLMRIRRLADGPDEQHHMVVGRAEIARYQTSG
jgi:acyl-CoA dehydrogenase